MAEDLDAATFGGAADDDGDFDMVGNSKAATGLMKLAEAEQKAEQKASAPASHQDDAQRVAMSSVLNILDDDDDDDDDHDDAGGSSRPKPSSGGGLAASSAGWQMGGRPPAYSGGMLGGIGGFPGWPSPPPPPAGGSGPPPHQPRPAYSHPHAPPPQPNHPNRPFHQHQHQQHQRQQQQQQQPRPPLRHQRPAGAISAEEFERQLTLDSSEGSKDPPGGAKMNPQQPQQQPPAAAAAAKKKKKGAWAQLLRRGADGEEKEGEEEAEEEGEGKGGKGGGGNAGGGPGLPPGYHHRHHHHHHPHRHQPPFPPGMIPPGARHPQQPPFPPGSRGGGDGRGHAHHHHHPRYQPGRQQQQRQPRGPPSAGAGAGAGAAAMPPGNFPLHRQGQHQGQGHPLQQRHPHHPLPPPPHHHQHHHHRRPQHPLPQRPPQQRFPHRPGGHQNTTAAADGQPPRPSHFIQLPKMRRFQMMTKAEIALVIRMQLTQLKTTNPMNDDFYYQVYQSRRGIFTAQAASLERFKSKSNTPRNPDGTPKLESSTLGRIKVSSLRQPKRLMDLTGGVDEEEAKEDAKSIEDGKQGKALPPARKYMFGWLGASYLIEEGMRCLVQIEDVDSGIMALRDPRAFADPSRQYNLEQLNAERKQQVLNLCEALDIEQLPNPSDDHTVLKFAGRRKGRLLLDRSLLLLPPRKARVLTAIILHGTKEFACHATKTDVTLAEDVCKVLSSMPLKRLNFIFHSLAKQAKAQGGAKFMGSALACKCLQAILKRAHEVQGELAHMQMETQARGGAPSPEEGQLKVAVGHWRQIYDFFSALLKGRLKSGLFTHYLESADKVESGETKDAKDSKDKGSKSEKAAANEAEGGVPAALRELWEFLAAMVSHGSPAQKDSLRSEAVELLKDARVDPNSTGASLDDLEVVDTSETPIGTLPSRGYQYLSSVYIQPPPAGTPGAQ